MKMKSVLLLAVALGCGLVAMLGVQQALSGNKEGESGVSRVLVAITEINPETRLNETNSVFKEWPANAIPEGAVTSSEQIEDRALMAYAIPGEILLEAKFGDEGVYAASNEIPEGMRLATVSVNLTKTHSGLMMPGDHVDLVLTYKYKTANRGMVPRTITILENVEVFATDSKRTSSRADSNGGELKAKNISLLVTPEQYQVCMMAESQGKLTLALRNSKDSVLVNTAPMDGTIFEKSNIANSLFQEENQAVEKFLTSIEEEQVEEADDSEEIEVVVQEPPTWEIAIYEGNQVRVVEVELPEDGNGADMRSSFTGPNDRNGQNSLKSLFIKWLN